MSILITGMEMPKDRAIIEIHPAGGYACTRYGFEIGKVIELPPHGRLIDADALMDGWMNLREATKYGNETKEQMSHSYSTMMMYEIADVIEDAPTIIQADGGAGG